MGRDIHHLKCVGGYNGSIRCIGREGDDVKSKGRDESGVIKMEEEMGMVPRWRKIRGRCKDGG